MQVNGILDNDEILLATDCTQHAHNGVMASI